MRPAEPAERDAVVSALLCIGSTQKHASMVLAWLLVPGASLLRLGRSPARRRSDRHAIGGKSS
jgi:hypothetical protein